MKKLPAQAALWLRPLFISIFMSCLVSAVSTLKSVGLAGNFWGVWPTNWLTSWLVAFPILLLVLPLVQRLVNVFVETPTKH